MEKKSRILKGVLKVCLAIVLIAPLCLGAAAENTKAETARTFTHPGMLHTEESFEAMRKHVENQVQPAYDTWNYLYANGFSDPNWQPRATEVVVRGGEGSNYAGFHIDIRRAYQTALVWQISGKEEYGEAACRILNAWSGKMTELTGNADCFLAAGIYGYELANVSEMMREHPSFDKEAMETLLLDVFYPRTLDFLTNHNGAHFGNYWANWDLCNIASMMAIGIYTDREDIYQQAVDYYRNGIGMGSLYNAMPYVYEEEGLAQWQESGRDQGHTTLGISLCGAVCEMAWNQGDDLYSLSDNRFLKAAEYVAKYNNMEDVPYNPYERYAGQTGRVEFGNEVSAAGRGSVRPVYSLVYNHYVTRMGMEAPVLEQILFPDSGYHLELECGNGDELGWQTLTFLYTGEAAEPKENAGILPDGIYRIRSAYTGKSLVAKKDGTLSLARRGSNLEEWWKFENTGDGEYVITNMATGQVLQTTENLYANDTVYTTGSSQKSMKQKFAVIKNETEDYRILSSINGFALSIRDESLADDAAVVQWKYFAGRAQKWLIETTEDIEEADTFMRADFTFDNEIDGFVCEHAIAKGSYSLENSYDEEHGKAIYLDASNKEYLTITAPDGSALLTGAKELTISFDVKVDRTETNWAFYLSADDSSQVYPKEKYIGIMMKDGNTAIERYNNTGKRPATPVVETGSDWVTLTVVMDNGGTEVFINGEKAAEQASGYALDTIIGESGVLYIGKANWGEGEYFQGWIDNLTICNRALSIEQLKTLEDTDIKVPEFEPDREPLPYVDVTEGDWFYDAVAYTYYEGLMTGMDEAHFGPYGQLSRAQFALILYRMQPDAAACDAANAAQKTITFKDVTGDEWYGPAVLWAAKNGIVTGYQNGNFGPADYITREQMAVMMYRYAHYISQREQNLLGDVNTVGYAAQDASLSGDYSAYKDAEKVSPFASEALSWAVGNGIITGKEQGTVLEPQGNTARAEAAVIIQRYTER